jgi:hypothetical protein
MPSALTVDREIAQQRLSICRKCKHFRQGVRPTCGTPIVGEEVTYRGKKRRTCGCFLDLKVKFAGTACPLGKWGMRKDEDALMEDARALMAEINPSRITVTQHRELARLYPQLVARRTTVQRCPPCIQTAIHELEQYLQHRPYEDDQADEHQAQP